MGKLNLLNGWASIESYFTRRSAQSYLNSNQMAMAATGCSSSCGGDDAKPQPSACGAGDDAKPQPSACGAGDDSQPKPSACGAGDGK
jgi:hypothetical protein